LVEDGCAELAPDVVGTGGFPLLHRPPAVVMLNVGSNLDRLILLLPPGAPREFVRALPRRIDREQLFADLEALVRLLHVAELR
jgi:hypothetical protein